jgi:hypothetical protein
MSEEELPPGTLVLETNGAFGGRGWEEDTCGLKGSVQD